MLGDIEEEEVQTKQPSVSVSYSCTKIWQEESHSSFA